MKRVFTIGEALIDFIPNQKGIALKDVETFEKAPGGAPANVASCVAKLGGTSSFIGKLGKDAFGEFLVDTIESVGVDTRCIQYTSEANTALAFVSLKEDGNRDFSFYRNPSADLLLDESEINEQWFNDDILHFCSVDLVDAPVKKAHIKAIELMKEKGGLISFDPNVRLPLWDSKEACKETIQEFIPKADIVKISDEELSFITEIEDDEEKAIQSLFQGNVKLVLYTLGSKGAKVYTKDKNVFVKGYNVKAVDTTGAGDAFIGAFLYQLSKNNIDINNLNESIMKELLLFSNAVGAITASKKGAISSLPTIEEVKDFMAHNKNG